MHAKTGPQQRLKKELSAPGMIAKLRTHFAHIAPPQEQTGPGPKRAFSDEDLLTAGLAIFGLKLPSLLQLNNGRVSHTVCSNLASLYQISKIPSDTTMRERLDEIDPKLLQKGFTDLFELAQRNHLLKPFYFSATESYLVSVDGSEYFSSYEVHCDNCCCRTKNKKEQFYHQSLVASLVHPDSKQVLCLGHEPIAKEDGSNKNDCEMNAMKRWLTSFFQQHPKLPTTFLFDALSTKTPLLKQILKRGASFIANVKPGSHKTLFEWVEGVEPEGKMHQENLSKKESIELNWYNACPLTGDSKPLLVNLLIAKVTKKGSTKTFSWATNHTITQENAYELSRAGRSRWKIENETFNTLKNQGYHFEHNYGHGKKHLTQVFCSLMLLAFLIDQLQEIACGLFQRALANQKGCRSKLWSILQGLFLGTLIEDWSFVWAYIGRDDSIAGGGKGTVKIPAPT